MAYHDDFIHVLTGPPAPSRGGGSSVSEDFFQHSKGEQVLTEAVMIDAIRQRHPKHHLMITPTYGCDLPAWSASRQDVTCSLRGDAKDSFIETNFAPPARRYGDENGGHFVERVVFGCYDLTFEGNTFLLYIVEGAMRTLYASRFNYILFEDDTSDMSLKAEAQAKIKGLVAVASKWFLELHREVLMFDNGYWQKNSELYENIQKARWEDVILEKEKKDAIVKDVIGFFDAEKRYTQFGVPWKRGLIFYGPPGNGKTITTKALLRDLSQRVNPSVETLYVKSLNSYLGPEYGVRQVFLQARRMAPCLLLFEDLDALISPLVRSYFLNEVDGLESNHGILMIGSTNHLDRLDPGIAKRPSRFDRKYLFEVPSREERVQYCEYWRHKLRANKEVEFPESMSARVADITDGFSFAYMKEAMVASLLTIVRGEEMGVRGREDGDDLSGNLLWTELQKQIANLRKEMEGETASYKYDEEEVVAGISSHGMPQYTHSNGTCSRRVLPSFR